MKVLLVDDSVTMRKMQKAYLAEIDVSQFLEAANGRDALEVLRANMPVNVVVLDVNMPEMDGIAVLKTIRADRAYERVRVIMCTSESEKGKVLEAMSAGANNYIVKPFSPESFKEKVVIEGGVAD